MTTTTTALEQQIAALLHQLEETKEAKRLEAAQKEAEAAAEKARVEEEQQRLQAKAEAEAKHVRHDVDNRRVKQEHREREQEEEARRCWLCEELSLTPLAALETELPRSKGKGLELALESEGGQESQRCDSCEKQNAECIRLKVHGSQLISTSIDSLTDRKIPLLSLSPLPGAKDSVLHRRWSSGPVETAMGGGPW